MIEAALAASEASRRGAREGAARDAEAAESRLAGASAARERAEAEVAAAREAADGAASAQSGEPSAALEEEHSQARALLVGV